MTRTKTVQPSTFEISAEPVRDDSQRAQPVVEVVSAPGQRTTPLRLRPPTRLFPDAPPLRRRDV